MSNKWLAGLLSALAMAIAGYISQYGVPFFGG